MKPKEEKKRLSYEQMEVIKQRMRDDAGTLLENTELVYSNFIHDLLREVDALETVLDQMDFDIRGMLDSCREEEDRHESTRKEAQEIYDALEFACGDHPMVERYEHLYGKKFKEEMRKREEASQCYDDDSIPF